MIRRGRTNEQTGERTVEEVPWNTRIDHAEKRAGFVSRRAADVAAKRAAKVASLAAARRTHGPVVDLLIELGAINRTLAEEAGWKPNAPENETRR